MNIKILILIILFSILKFYDFSYRIEIVVKENEFYAKNKELIDYVVKNIYNNCQTKEKIKLNLNFDFMPPQLQAINPYENGRTSIFINESWIEINSQFWSLNNENLKKNLLYHEIGHSLGINHNESINNIMNENSSDKGDVQLYLKEVRNHCRNLRKLPTSNTY